VGEVSPSPAVAEATLRLPPLRGTPPQRPRLCVCWRGKGNWPSITSMRRFLFAFLFVSTLVFATTAVSLDLNQLTLSSNAIYRATVISVDSRWTTDHSRIITDATLEVIEVFKGEKKSVAVVMQPGGVVGEIGQAVSGTAQFKVGEEVIVFLEARGPNFTVSGLSMGKFSVQRSTDGTAAYVVPSTSGLELVDEKSHQASAPKVQTLTLVEFKKQIANAAPKATDAADGPTKVQIK
jgi:hypothetical protein